MNRKPSKFRNSNGQRYTLQLFYEIWRDTPVDRRLIDPIYSLHDDIEGLINFGAEYVRDMDTTGYKTSLRLLENYDHWLLLMNRKWFREAKEKWDKQINARLEQEATDALRALLSLSGDLKPSEAISAAKAIFTRVDRDKPSNGASRGRPSKEEIKGKLKQEADLTKEEEEDAARIIGFTSYGQKKAKACKKSDR